MKNTKRYKKSVNQELELLPIYTTDGGRQAIKSGGQTVQIIFVFNKFTMPDKKKLGVVLWEKKRDRNLAVTINGKTILKALT